MEKIKALYIDLFCGAGGTSTGVECARINGKKCAKVIACVNHDANAIASHAANHPDALHFTEDIRTLELSPLVAHIEKMKAAYPGALVVLWASLECTNFSKAKGGKPRDAESRTLAEHLFRYIKAINPDYIQIENVEEFMSWGDLDENRKPVSKDKGRKYLQWVDDVRYFGKGLRGWRAYLGVRPTYNYQYRILNAADYGAYTSRKRFFGIFAKDKLPITFPKPAYSKTGSKDLFGNVKKWKPVKDVLNFADEGESIFTRKKSLSDRTFERIYAGLIKFVAGGKDKFLSKYYSGHPDSKNFSVEEPAHTVTSIDHHALINASFIQQRNTGKPESKVFSIERPARTLTATGGNQELVQAKFIGRYNGQPNQDVNAVSVEVPAPILTTIDRLSLISTKFIVNEYSGGGQHSSIDEVCPAILTNPKQKVVSCKGVMGTDFNNKGTSIETEPLRRIKEFMALYGIIDIKMRMLKIPELKRIMGFPEDYTLIGTQAEQKKYIGNAVEVNMARVLCETLVQSYTKLKFLK
jgi:DNA (cytosine-5)-methyltransferase 1